MKITMILFLSSRNNLLQQKEENDEDYKNRRKEDLEKVGDKYEYNFKIDEKEYFGEVYGLQTNEAPVLYAIERLKVSKNELGKIIVLRTPTAENTSWERFKTAIGKVYPKKNIIPVDILDNVTTTELFKKTLEALKLESFDGKVIIETTGGYRNAINALTLLSRFLLYRGIDVEFSTFSDFYNKPKIVADTSETDNIFKLLEALNLFTTKGDPRGLRECLECYNINNIKNFYESATTLYKSMLVCDVSKIQKNILDLKTKSINIKNLPGNYEKYPLLIIFKNLFSEIVFEKMTFLSEQPQDLDLSFIKWCIDNNYIQFAVTVLYEIKLNVYIPQIKERLKKIYEKQILVKYNFETDNRISLYEFFSAMKN